MNVLRFWFRVLTFRGLLCFKTSLDLFSIPSCLQGKAYRGWLIKYRFGYNGVLHCFYFSSDVITFAHPFPPCLSIYQEPVAAVVIMACDRADYLERTIKSVLKYVLCLSLFVLHAVVRFYSLHTFLSDMPFIIHNFSSDIRDLLLQSIPSLYHRYLTSLGFIENFAFVL